MDHEEMKRVLDRARQGTMEERLTKHAVNCVEGELLLQTVAQLNSLKQRLEAALEDVRRLERTQQY
jgi:hypothetical protein